MSLALPAIALQAAVSALYLVEIPFFAAAYSAFDMVEPMAPVLTARQNAAETAVSANLLMDVPLRKDRFRDNRRECRAPWRCCLASPLQLRSGGFPGPAMQPVSA